MSDFFDIANLEQFCQEHPDSIAFAFLASRYLEAGDAAKAREVAQSGLARHPDYAFGHYILGLTHQQLQEPDKAREHLQRSVAFNDKNPQAWKRISELAGQSEAPREAREATLQYFLMDSFSKDAVQRFQREDMLQFDQFDADDSEAAAEAAENEREIDSLFEDDNTDNEDIDISSKVEAVFKETLGDITMGTERSEAERATAEEEDSAAADAFEHIPEGDDDDATRTDVAEADDSPESLDFGRIDEKDIPEPDDNADLEEFFEKYDAGDDEDPDLSGPDLPEDTTDADDGEDDLDAFSSVVNEIIAEKERTAPPMPDSPADEAAEPPAVEPETDSATEAPPADSDEVEPQRTRFGKPPILSPTLGEIYIAQGRFEEAIEVFEQLLEKDPENHRFQKKIQDIRQMLERR